MDLKIPANFPLNKLIDKWKKQGSYRVSLENKLDTLFILLNEFYRTNIHTAWAIPVRFHSETIEKVCGRIYYKVMKDLLSDEFGNILTTDGKYRVKGYSKGYKLKFGYCFSDEVMVELHSAKIVERYQAYLNGLRNYSEIYQPIDPVKTHLFDQFEGITLTLDERINKYLELKYRALKNEIDRTDNLKYQYHLYAIAGKLQYFISFIEKNDHHPKISSSNHRLNSLFTLCPKELRYFLRVNSNELLELDVKASHPYVLATILNYNFFNDIKKGYNLKTIYPEIYYAVESYVEAKNNITINNTEARKVASLRLFPHLSANFYNHADIQDYKKIDFEHDFYKVVESLLKKASKYQTEIQQEQREQLKTDTLIWLNSTDPVKRKKLTFFVKKFAKRFPSIELLIRDLGFFSQYKSAFSILLQRAESHLILDIAAKPLIQMYPKNKIFTIHDCFLIENTDLNAELAIKTIQQALVEYTGFKPGVSIKHRDSFEAFDMYLKKNLAQAAENAKQTDERVFDEEDRIFNSETNRLIELGIETLENGKSAKTKLLEFEEFLVKEYGD